MYLCMCFINFQGQKAGGRQVFGAFPGIILVF